MKYSLLVKKKRKGNPGVSKMAEKSEQSRVDQQNGCRRDGARPES